MAQTAQINIRVDEKQAQSSVDNLNKSLQQTETTTTSLRTQLRQVTQELQGLEPGSARFNELSQRAGQLRDTIQDTSAVIKATAGNLTENLAKGLTNVASIGVNAFQGIMGAAALFGVENENLQKTMVALQGAMALTSSLEFFGGLEDKVTEIKASFQGLGQALGLVRTQQAATAASATALAVGETAAAGATTAAGAAAGAAVVPTTALGTAMKAIPLVAIIAGFVALTAVVYQYVSAKQKASQAQKLSNDVSREGATSIVKELSASDRLSKQLKDETLTRQQKIQKIKEFQAAYPGLLSNMNAETNSIAQINAQLELNIGLLRLQAKAKAIETKREEEYKKIIELQTNTNEENLGVIDRTKTAVMDFFGLGGGISSTQTMGMINRQTAIDGIDENLNKLDELDKANMQEMEALGKKGAKIVETTGVVKDYSKGLAGNTNELNKQNEALEKRRILLDAINERLQREKTATQQLEELNNDREIIVSESDNKIITLRNKHEQELAKIDLDADKFRTSLIENATQRQIKSLEERFVNGTMSENAYIDELKKINQNGANNLLQVEKDLIDRKQELSDVEKERIKNDLLERNSDNIAAADLLYYQLGQSKVQFDKQMALKEIETSNKSEEEKKKLRLETLKYYEEVEIQQINNITEKELDILYEKYQDDLKLAQENGEDTSKIEAQYQLDKVNMEQTSALKIQDIQGETKDKTVKNFQTTMESASEFLAIYGEAVMEIADSINQLLAQQNQQQIDNLNLRYKTESDNLQSLYDQKVLTEEEFNAQKKALDQQREQDEIKYLRKQFNRNKAFNIANAIMNGAQSILAITTVPDFTFGIATALRIAASAAVTAIQVGTISQQQFKAARGGIVPGSGPSNIDSVPSMLAPGEAVINANSAAMFPNTLSMINQAGGGISLAPEMPAQGSSGSGTIFSDNSNNQPLKAYVVETEITSSQKRVNRIERSVEF